MQILAFASFAIKVHSITGLVRTARAGSQSRYLQMYVLDTQHELHYRTNVVPNSNLNSVILQALKAMLDETNPMSPTFGTFLTYLQKILAIYPCLFTLIFLVKGLTMPPTASQVATIWIKAFARNGMVQGEYEIYTRNIVYKEAL